MRLLMCLAEHAGEVASIDDLLNQVWSGVIVTQLSKIPGLRVHAPMSSSSFKGKRITIAGMAEMLGVAYVLDGSVRKSGARLRVAARLIRADDEYVVWSETYDRPVDDILMVQDDIAGEVTKALRASIEARP
jgi:TolB-like protein